LECWMAMIKGKNMDVNVRLRSKMIGSN